MSSEKDLGYQLGLLSFIRPSAVLRNTSRLPTMSPRRLGRASAVMAAGVLGSPLRLIENLATRAELDATTIDQPPVFIIGHWRSGTTHLHNLLSNDDQFGCLRMSQALAPDCAMSTRSWLPQLFARVFPNKRPMDNLVWPMDAPQEEEIPLAKMTPYSWYLQFLFPKQALEMLRLGVLFEGTPPRVEREVRDKYLRILKTTSMLEDGRRLLLKNPVNTARIPMLLDLFPDARFVAIHRSPYEVFPSALNLHRKILKLTSFQSYDEALIEKNVLAIYQQVMGRYFADRAQIPAENLLEVSYSELDDHPERVVARVYDELRIDGYDDAKPAIASYIESQKNYRKNDFSLSERSVELVEDHWGFAFDELGYDRHTTSTDS